MLRSAAVPFLASLLAVSNVAAAAEPAPEAGPCYAFRPLPALPSGTRVFARPVLTIRTGRLDATMTAGDESVKPPAPAPSDPAIEIKHKDANGVTTTIRPGVTICAYPPGVTLPSNLSGVTPDLIMP